jgi:hypothetical protein
VRVSFQWKGFTLAVFGVRWWQNSVESANGLVGVVGGLKSLGFFVRVECWVWWLHDVVVGPGGRVLSVAVSGKSHGCGA